MTYFDIESVQFFPGKGRFEAAELFFVFFRFFDGVGLGDFHAFILLRAVRFY